MLAQSQGHHANDCPEKRTVERESTERSFLKGRDRAIISQTNSGAVSNATLWKLVRDRVERVKRFLERVDVILK